jgi:hypothetical protein
VVFGVNAEQPRRMCDGAVLGAGWRGGDDSGE